MIPPLAGRSGRFGDGFGLAGWSWRCASRDRFLVLPLNLEIVAQVRTGSPFLDGQIQSLGRLFPQPRTSWNVLEAEVRSGEFGAGPPMAAGDGPASGGDALFFSLCWTSKLVRLLSGLTLSSTPFWRINGGRIVGSNAAALPGDGHALDEGLLSETKTLLSLG